MVGADGIYHRGITALNRLVRRQPEQTAIYKPDVSAICLAVQQGPLEQMVSSNHIVEVDDFTYHIANNRLGFSLETKNISERDENVEKKIKADFLFFNYLCQTLFGKNKELIMNNFSGVMDQNMGFSYDGGPIVSIYSGLRGSKNYRYFSVMLNVFCLDSKALALALFSEILKYNNGDYGVKIKFSPEVEEQIQDIRNKLSLFGRQEELK